MPTHPEPAASRVPGPTPAASAARAVAGAPVGARVGKRSVPGARAGQSATQQDGGRPAERSDELIVGEGVRFTGRISSCARLIVAGRVDAQYPGDSLEILESGSFRGEASVHTARIEGTFDGTLTVSGTLTLAATARVTGQIRYETLEVAAGAELRGDVDRWQADSSGDGVRDAAADSTAVEAPTDSPRVRA